MIRIAGQPDHIVAHRRQTVHQRQPLRRGRRITRQGDQIIDGGVEPIEHATAVSRSENMFEWYGAAPTR
ncbi:hypothetical protein B8W66_08025 [Mycobacterium decipiens]|uniref:Uncharacterized protein n=1 Tax=Mycobacterium decipiens TaxID=1430326 RepID=A0A1X2LX55_9MYCO|nr:hypothetical protein B8W66_08025 [Mycobacterium decipiens]